MAPSSALAALFLLSLIPGWIFLRATHDSRLPRSQGALGESLELVTIGVATTGLASVVAVLCAPARVFDALSVRTHSELRSTVGLGLLIFGGAVVLALIAAHVYRRLFPIRYGTSVWHETLSDQYLARDQLNYLAVQTHDGGLFEGVLHSFTHGSDDAHRDVTLKAPIFAHIKQKRCRTPYDFLIFPAESMRHIAVSRMPVKPDDTASREPAGPAGQLQPARPLEPEE